MKKIVFAAAAIVAVAMVGHAYADSEAPAHSTGRVSAPGSWMNANSFNGQG